jgi:hypothetical protein
MSRPSFATTIAALRTTDRRFPWVGPTDEETEVADVLAELEELHQPGTDEPDARGRYGRCTGCRNPWPCEGWQFGEQLALQWLGRAADRVTAHALAAWDRGRAA